MDERLKALLLKAAAELDAASSAADELLKTRNCAKYCSYAGMCAAESKGDCPYAPRHRDYKRISEAKAVLDEIADILDSSDI